MPQVGFESTTPAYERAKTVHALDGAATVIDTHRVVRKILQEHVRRFANADEYYIRITCLKTNSETHICILISDRPRAGRPRNWGSISIRGRGFLFPSCCSDRFWDPPAFSLAGSEVYFPADTAWSCHSPLPRTEIKNTWTFTSIHYTASWRGADHIEEETVAW
jgi:hypothetical protein